MKIKFRIGLAVSVFLMTPLLTQVGIAADLEKLRNPRRSYTVVGTQGLVLPSKVELASRTPARSQFGPLSVSREQSVVPISFQGPVSRLK